MKKVKNVCLKKVCLSDESMLSIESMPSIPLISSIVDKKINSLEIRESIILKAIKKMPFLGKGNFGFVYDCEDGTVTKFSHILRKINDYILKNDAIDSVIDNYMNEFDNELNQIIQFGQLKSLFPNNIISIYETYKAILEDDIFPVNVAKMEYVKGINVFDFLEKINDFDIFLQFIKQCLKVLMNINLLGFFHNDLNLKNIMVKNVDYNINNTFVPVPVLIDYSFSKKINTVNLFPIECSIWIFQIKKYFEDNTQYSNKNFDKTVFFNLVDYFTGLNVEYNIYETVFIEKFIVGTGIFTYEDYSELPLINQSDIDKMNVMIDTLC